MGEPRGLRAGELHLPGLSYLHPVHVLSQLARPVPLPMGVPPFTLPPTPPLPHALKMMGGSMGAMYPWGLNLHNPMLGSLRPGGPQGRGPPSPERHHDRLDDGKGGWFCACGRAGVGLGVWMSLYGCQCVCFLFLLLFFFFRSLSMRTILRKY